jgi:formylglycine-generating enzyme required for sulfatase activity
MKKLSRYEVPKVVAKVKPVEKPPKSKRGLWIFLAVLVIFIIGLIATVVQREEPEYSPHDKAEPSRQPHSEAKPGDIITNSIGMKLVYMPPDKFMMGSPPNEKGRYSDEGPQHRVEISRGFYMGVTEVTQAQYRAIMGSNPSHFKGDEKELPVESISWNDAAEFCKKLSQKEGKAYRLPTEAEWEYACRAGTTTPFNTGETISTEQANYNGNYVYGTGRKGVYRGKTIAVGSFEANAFGLYDMHGNVWEWCSDWYDTDYYSKSGDLAVDPENTQKTDSRVFRGGLWSAYPGFCRSASRDGSALDYRSSSIGFRVVSLGFQ